MGVCTREANRSYSGHIREEEEGDEEEEVIVLPVLAVRSAKVRTFCVNSAETVCDAHRNPWPAEEM